MLVLYNFAVPVILSQAMLRELKCYLGSFQRRRHPTSHHACRCGQVHPIWHELCACQPAVMLNAPRTLHPTTIQFLLGAIDAVAPARRRARPPALLLFTLTALPMWSTTRRLALGSRSVRAPLRGPVFRGLGTALPRLAARAQSSLAINTESDGRAQDSLADNTKFANNTESAGFRGEIYTAIIRRRKGASEPSSDEGVEEWRPAADLPAPEELPVWARSRMSDHKLYHETRKHFDNLNNCEFKSDVVINHTNDGPMKNFCTIVATIEQSEWKVVAGTNKLALAKHAACLRLLAELEAVGLADRLFPNVPSQGVEREESPDGILEVLNCCASINAVPFLKMQPTFLPSGFQVQIILEEHGIHAWTKSESYRTALGKSVRKFKDALQNSAVAGGSTQVAGGLSSDNAAEFLAWLSAHHCLKLGQEAEASGPECLYRARVRYSMKSAEMGMPSPWIYAMQLSHAKLAADLFVAMRVSQKHPELLQKFLGKAVVPPAVKTFRLVELCLSPDVERLMINAPHVEQARQTSPSCLGPFDETLSEQILLGVLFRCLDPIVFTGWMAQRAGMFDFASDHAKAAESQMQFSNESNSDQLAQYKAFASVRECLLLRGELLARAYAGHRSIKWDVFQDAHRALQDVEVTLQRVGVLGPREEPARTGMVGGKDFNVNSHKAHVVKAVLVAAQSDIAVRQGESALFRTSHRRIVRLSRSSLLWKRGRAKTRWPEFGGSGVVSFKETADERRMKYPGIVMQEASIISPLMAALFGRRLAAAKHPRGSGFYINNWFSLALSAAGKDESDNARRRVEQRELMLRFRTNLDNARSLGLDSLARGPAWKEELSAKGVLDFIGSVVEVLNAEARDETWARKAADDISTGPSNVPEWGGESPVRGTAADEVPQTISTPSFMAGLTGPLRPWLREPIAPSRPQRSPGEVVAKDRHFPDLRPWEPTAPWRPSMSLGGDRVFEEQGEILPRPPRRGPVSNQPWWTLTPPSRPSRSPQEEVAAEKRRKIPIRPLRREPVSNRPSGLRSWGPTLPSSPATSPREVVAEEQREFLVRPPRREPKAAKADKQPEKRAPKSWFGGIYDRVFGRNGSGE